MKRLLALLLTLVMIVTAATSCGMLVLLDEPSDAEASAGFKEESGVPSVTDAATTTGSTTVAPTTTAPPAVTRGQYYYDVESVVLYLHTYGELPDNYITKSEAGDLGWSGGSVERYKDDAAIGGDRFGNREGLLPKASGRSYTECYIDTRGANSRGAKRLVFSNDGLYFYTDDHYESFTEYRVENGRVVKV